MAKKILIVDDEKDLVETLTFRFEAAGYQVIAAYDGMEGLDKVKKDRPDLIILDVMMPKMDGYTVCRMLKFSETTKGIPIIMLTARGQDQDKALGKGVGADHYMTKPFEGSDLAKLIKQVLGE